MTLLIMLLLICVVVGSGVVVLLKGQTPSKALQTSQDGDRRSGAAALAESAAPIYTYSRHTYLFTRAEASFYRALQASVSDDYLILGKVRVADILKPSAENRSDWQRAFNQISAKHVDFVLCDHRNSKILAVVELDDSSHQRADRVRRDDFLNRAMASARLPLLRFPVSPAYDADSIRQTITQAIAPTIAAPTASSPPEQPAQPSPPSRRSGPPKPPRPSKPSRPPQR